jgi:hypothetical protein
MNPRMRNSVQVDDYEAQLNWVFQLGTCSYLMDECSGEFVKVLVDLEKPLLSKKINGIFTTHKCLTYITALDL